LAEFRYGYSKQNFNRVPVGGSFDPGKLGFDPGFVSQAALEGEMFPHFGFGGNGSFSDLAPWAMRNTRKTRWHRALTPAS
jgi:hypothetical protein